MVAPLILIIEDEPAIQELIQFHLQQSGYQSLCAKTGKGGLEATQKNSPSLVILDLMLPDLDGIEVCRQLKRNSKTRSIPILILTARGEEVDRILGLEVGADDYVTKPFSPKELILRIRAILRRGDEISKGPQKFKFGPLDVDVSKPLVLYKGNRLDLTVLEIRLLQHLYRTRGHVQSRDLLLENVWGYQSSIHTRTVDAHIKRLREKLEEGGEFIETIRGIGYRFKEL